MSTLLNDGGGNSGSNSGGNQDGSNGGSGAGTSGGSSGGTVSWRDTLPDDIKGNGALSQFKDVGSLAKSWVHAQSMIGKKGVVVPGDKAEDAEWSTFFKSIGQPERDKFDVKLPQDFQGKPEVLDQFKEVAHKSGLLPKQAQGLLDWYAKTEQDSMAAKKTAADQSSATQLEALKKEWSAGYDKQIALAKLAVKEVGGPEFAQYLEETGLGNDVRIIKLMNKVGGLLGEDKIRGEAGGSNFGQTPAEIKKEIGSIMGNPAHPYFNPNHPGHKAAVTEMSGLYQKLGG